MGFVQTFRQKRRSSFQCAASLAALFLLAAPCFSQSKPGGQSAELPWTKDLNKYPGLLPEFSKLIGRLKHDVQYPPPRTESRLLPLLPASTVSYAAFPNYGDVTEQALKIFRQMAQQNPDVYLPSVAETLHVLGILDGSQNRVEESRAHYQEALRLLLKLSEGDHRYAGAVASVQASLEELEKKTSNQ